MESPYAQELRAKIDRAYARGDIDNVERFEARLEQVLEATSADTKSTQYKLFEKMTPAKRDKVMAKRFGVKIII